MVEWGLNDKPVEWGMDDKPVGAIDKPPAWRNVAAGYGALPITDPVEEVNQISRAIDLSEKNDLPATTVVQNPDIYDKDDKKQKEIDTRTENAIRSTAGVLLSTFPSPINIPMGMLAVNTKKSDVVLGFMEAMSRIEGDKKLFRDYGRRVGELEERPKRYPYVVAGMGGFDPSITRETAIDIPFHPIQALKEAGKGVVRFGEAGVGGTFGGTAYDWLGQFIEQGGIAIDQLSKLGSKNKDQIYNPLAEAVIATGQNISAWGKASRQAWAEQAAYGWEAFDPALKKNDPISYGAGRLSEGVASSALSVLSMYLSGGAAAPALLNKGLQLNRGLLLLSGMSAASGFQHAQEQKENFFWSTVAGLSDGAMEYYMESRFLEGVNEVGPITAGLKEASEELFTGLFQNTRAGVLENEKKGMSAYKGAKEAFLGALMQAPWEMAAGFIGGWGISQVMPISQLVDKWRKTTSVDDVDLVSTLTPEGLAKYKEKMATEKAAKKSSETPDKATKAAPAVTAPKGEEVYSESMLQPRLSPSRANRAYIMPAKVGSKFTREQKEWLKKQFRIKEDSQGRMVTYSKNEVANAINEMTWAETARDKVAREKREQAEMEATERMVERQKILGSNEASVAWIDRIFGDDAMNEYNKTELVKYLTGETQKYAGLVGTKWESGLRKLNALGSEGKVDFKKIKAEYKKQVAPAPAVTAQKGEVIERPKTPKGLKVPLSELSDAELASREAKASPYHKVYVQEIAWRKQQAAAAPEAIGTSGQDAGRIKVSMEPKSKVQTAREIIQHIEKAFNIPLRGVATHRKKYLGWFSPKAVGIRLKDVRDLTTAMHEIGHHIDWTLNKRLSKNPPNTEMGKELVVLGKALYGDTKPPGGYKSEGWAEFIREYLTGDEAESKAPAVYKWFKEEYLPANSDINKKLNATKKMITKWRLQGAEARIESQISKKQPKGTMFERLQRAGLWVEKAFRSEIEPIRRAMAKVGIKESEILPGDNPYQIAVARADKAGAIARFFVEENTTDLSGNVTGKGLREILNPVAKDIKNFTQWIVSARARLLHKRGINPGISSADANYVYEKYDNPQWQETLKEITGWNHRVLDYLVEAGGMDKNAQKVIIAANPIYVPFMREFTEGEINLGQGIGKGIAKTTKAVKKIRGSGRAIIDPIESMIQQAAKIIGIAHKTEVALALAKLSNIKGTAGMIWKVPAPKQATQFEAEQLKKDIARIAYQRMGLDPEEVSSAMLERWDEILTVYSNASHYYGKDNIVSFSIDGKQQFFEVEPSLYRAIEGLDRYTMPRVWDFILGKPARAVRLGATGLNASFGLIRNFLRDALTFTVLSEYATAGPVSAVKGIAEDIAKTTGAQKFKSLGGKMSAQILADRRALQHLRKEVLVSTMQGKIVYTVAHPVDALRELFGVTEAGTRIGEFVPALKAAEKEYGKGSKSAAIVALNAAQDVTTNFSRHGQIGKILNQIIPFFNAAIQGPDKILRTFNKRPAVTSLKAISALTLPALLLWWRHKDDEWYKNMPDYERVNYMHFKIPGKETIIRIPVPFELGHIFQSAPVAALDAMYRDDPKFVTEMFSEALDQANPADWPAVISPIIDILANRDFAGRPIVPKGIEYKMPQDQYKHYTTDLMKLIGEMIQYSPAKLEHLVNNYSGGLYNRVVRSINLKDKEVITASDMPVIGTLFMREPYAPKAQLNRFYTKRDELNSKHSSKRISGKDILVRKLYNKAADRISEQLKKLPDAKTVDDKMEIYSNIKTVLKRLER